MRKPKPHNGQKVNSRFLKFEKNISLTPLKKKRLSKSMFALDAKLNNYLTQIDKLCHFRTEVQGSFKMGTIVIGKNGTYDIDVGVWFIKKPTLTAQTIKNHIYQALVGHTTGGIIKKDKCVRVIYAGDYHVDLPIYYKTPKDEYPLLGTKDYWIPTDPQGFCKWFKSKKAGKPQLVRIVKYLKYWANTKVQKMPSGMAITVWVVENFVEHERDDIAIYETAKLIYKKVDKAFECENPTHPNDNLMDRLTINQKIYFWQSLRGLIELAEKANMSTDEKTATEIWTKIFGSRFYKNNFKA